MKKTILYIIMGVLLLGIGGIGGYFFATHRALEGYKKNADNINSFEECAKHWPVQETYPATCRANGKTFTQ